MLDSVGFGHAPARAHFVKGFERHMHDMCFTVAIYARYRTQNEITSTSSCRGSASDCPIPDFDGQMQTLRTTPDPKVDIQADTTTHLKRNTTQRVQVPCH